MLQCRVGAFIALLGALGSAVHGEDVRLYRADETPDPHEVARILNNGSRGLDAREFEDQTPRTRGFKLAAPATPSARSKVQSSGIQSGKTSPARDRSDAIALPIQFDFDSAELLPAARRQLDALAQGINLLDIERRVVIEGHTDGVGSDEYNLELSLRRAVAVRQYLVTVHGIHEARLQTLGLGKTRPLFDKNSPANRRVQFHGG
ncbi:MAG: OmpA family protein [Variovorax sp.]|nr:MAG: OmpA family protein [Variovorax sp.]